MCDGTWQANSHFYLEEQTSANNIFWRGKKNHEVLILLVSKNKSTQHWTERAQVNSWFIISREPRTIPMYLRYSAQAPKEVLAFYESLRFYPCGSAWGWLCSNMTSFLGCHEGQLTQTETSGLKGKNRSLSGQMKSPGIIDKRMVYSRK